jgi:hypothetical protein
MGAGVRAAVNEHRAGGLSRVVGEFVAVVGYESHLTN